MGCVKRKGGLKPARKRSLSSQDVFGYCAPHDPALRLQWAGDDSAPQRTIPPVHPSTAYRTQHAATHGATDFVAKAGVGSLRAARRGGRGEGGGVLAPARQPTAASAPFAATDAQQLAVVQEELAIERWASYLFRCPRILPLPRSSERLSNGLIVFRTRLGPF